MGRKKKEVVNPEFAKLVEQAKQHGLDIDVETISGMDDGQRDSLDRYLQGLDRNEKPDLPDFMKSDDVADHLRAVSNGEVETGEEAPRLEIFQDPTTGIFHSGMAEPGGGMESSVESTATVISDSDKLIADLREQVAGLQRQFNHVPMLTPRQQEALEVAEEVSQLSRFCHEVEGKYDKSDKETKSLKKAYETALKELQTAAERLDEVMGDGDYQKRLFPMASMGSYNEPGAVTGFPVTESVSAVFAAVDETGAISSETVIIEPGYDEGGAINLNRMLKADLEELKPGNGRDGLTAKKIDALQEAVGITIADLESWLQAGNTLDKIKGFGPEWITRTMDALGVIRDVYPVPESVVTKEQDDLVEPIENNAVLSLGEYGMKIELVDELEEVD